ncbi:MAG: hypothetical protein NTV34_12410, partial [Proteobacteria bacterium]|nr:hypothetical protein [Pseudomonadota bacterium]
SVRDGLASIVVPVMAVWAVVAIVFAVYFGPNRLKNDGNNAFRGDSLSQDEKAIAHKVASLNGLQGDHYSCALIFSTSTVYPQRFAALTGLRTCYDPSNSTSQVLQDFIQEWPIDFVYDPNEVTTKLPLHNVRLESLGQNLFAVHRKEES